MIAMTPFPAASTKFDVSSRGGDRVYRTCGKRHTVDKFSAVKVEAQYAP